MENEDNIQKWVLEILRRITNQSILFLIVLLGFSSYLLSRSSVYTSPASIGGFILLFVAVFYMIYTFSSLQTSEKYNEIIANYQKHIENLIKSQQAIESGWKKLNKDNQSQSNERYSKIPSTQTET